MESLKFDDGFKEYAINGDETKVVRFNPADPALLDRMAIAHENILQIADDMENGNITMNLDGTADEAMSDIKIAGEFISTIDRRIRDEIDCFLGSKVCDIAFGATSCLALANGEPLWSRFLNAVMPIIEKDVKVQQKASRERTDKYTKQVKGKKK